ncbi:MAG TPA: SDR family NAD(P)-dependent oxidoreductase, partial [Pseudomonadota bacterium]|nr:SDR family NAD(P)-dependent oxidoreductase [Pseudomonadota bacterium]
MDLGLKGKVVMVTGASRGLGRAMAQAFADEGARLSICARGADALEAAAAELRETVQRPDAVRAFAVDVGNPDSVRRLKTSVFDAFGEVALLMNNAG